MRRSSTTPISSRAISPRNSWSAIIPRRRDIGGLCLILDAVHLSDDVVAVANEALQAGIRLFQYRDKEGSRRRVYENASRLAEKLRSSGAVFIVNDHADIALATGADGVHLGQDDLPLAEARSLLGPDRVIGISTHSAEQAIRAESDGADYIGFGPLFATSTKDAGPMQGLERLRNVRRAVSLPILAIGGIDESNARSAIEAGADGIAVIGAVLRAPHIPNAITALLHGMGNRPA
ncbi:MAG: thiamine phosphate synthase [Nitrospiraceae bacterium]|nr:thiamine phosphate synthase [Nitrospiraceae bacterium]